MEIKQEENHEAHEEMLYRILQKCKREADYSLLIHPIEDFIGRVSYYTGTPIKKVQEIHKKLNYSMTNMLPMDFDTFVQVLKFIINHYSSNHLPTYEQLFDHLIGNTELTNIEELKEKLAVFGIHNRIIFKKTFLIEDENLCYARFFYLDKIKKLREKYSHIYYIDERIIDKSLSLMKPWYGIQSTSHGSQEYVLFYAISKFGYKNGLFCNHATTEEFHKWIVDILLRELEPSSVIIFDNSPLHGTLQTKAMTMHDTKQDMIKCLDKHNVPYHRKLSKVQLYDLIKKFVFVEETYPIDQIIKAHGHEVLRLPTNLVHLSPVHQMWEELRISLTKPLLDPLIFEIKDEIHAQIISMQNEVFLQFEQSVIEKENQLLILHIDLEKAQDKCLTYLKLNITTEEKNEGDILT